MRNLLDVLPINYFALSMDGAFALNLWRLKATSISSNKFFKTFYHMLSSYLLFGRDNFFQIFLFITNEKSGPLLHPH